MRFLALVVILTFNTHPLLAQVNLGVKALADTPAEKKSVRADDPDPIKDGLEKAKVTYQADMEKYREAVSHYFDKREQAAKETLDTTPARTDVEKFRKAVSGYFDQREDDARSLVRHDGLHQVSATPAVASRARCHPAGQQCTALR